MDINNKVVIISGAASGMGAATARYLAKQGAKLALLDINAQAAEAVAKEVQGFAINCDVCDANSMEQAIKQVVTRFSVAHVGVSCAGVAPAARMLSRDGKAMPLADFNEVLQINLVGSFNFMRVCAEQMATQNEQSDDDERGVIIHTASIAAYEGQIGQVAYSASKGGIVAMTLPAARELARHGIRVVTIAPGMIKTPLVDAMSDNVQQSLLTSIPFPKRFGQSQEYAQLVAEIIRNAYLNGSVIRLDAAVRLG